MWKRTTAIFILRLAPQTEATPLPDHRGDFPRSQVLTARNALLQALTAHGVNLKAQTPLTTSIRVQVLGFSFYDAWHFSRNDPQRGHAHGSAQVGSLWEIHPVFAIMFHKVDDLGFIRKRNGRPAFSKSSQDGEGERFGL